MFCHHQEAPILTSRIISCHICFGSISFSSPEPTILVACGRNRELWEQPFWPCAIDEDFVKPDGQNSVISFVISKWLLSELSIPATGQKDRRLWGREWLDILKGAAQNLPHWGWTLRIKTALLTLKRYNNQSRPFYLGVPGPGKGGSEFLLVFFFSEPASYYWFNGECRHALCMCDSEAVQCFKRAEFKTSLKNYPQEKC